MIKCQKCNRSFTNNGAFTNHKCVTKDDIDKVKELYYKNGLSLREIRHLGRFPRFITKLAIKNRRNLSEAMILARKKYPVQHTEESKKRLSKSTSKWLKTRINHPWRKKKETYPEKILRQWLECNVDEKIIQEYTPDDFDRNYRMDFAIINLKIDIEVNGNAHYFNNELKSYYVDREKYIIERGWKVINIHARAICKNFDTVINQLKQFLETKSLNVTNEIKLQKEIVINDVSNKAKEIIQLVDEGLDNKTIASKLAISERQLSRFFKINNIKKLSPCESQRLNKKKQIFVELAMVIDINEYGLISRLANKWQTSTTRMSHLVREFKNLNNRDCISVVQNATLTKLRS